MGSWVGEKDSQGVLRPTSKDARKPALYQALSLTHTATWQGGHSGGLVAPSAWLRRGEVGECQAGPTCREAGCVHRDGWPRAHLGGS